MERHIEWLENLEINEFTQYRQVEFPINGLRKKGFAKISDDKRHMTLLYHDHKDNWALLKTGANAIILSESKAIEKSVYDYIVNQNLSNL